MINIAKDIQSLSHFKRKTAEVMNRIRATGQPVVLTVNGKARLVVQDAAAYQKLLELAEKAEMQEFLRRSREDVDAGRTFPALEAIESLGRKKRK